MPCFSTPSDTWLETWDRTSDLDRLSSYIYMENYGKIKYFIWEKAGMDFVASTLKVSSCPIKKKNQISKYSVLLLISSFCQKHSILRPSPLVYFLPFLLNLSFSSLFPIIFSYLPLLLKSFPNCLEITNYTHLEKERFFLKHIRTAVCSCFKYLKSCSCLGVQARTAFTELSIVRFSRVMETL